MIPHWKMYTFTPQEAAEYDLQGELRQYRVLGAPDMLDLYSNHSQDHVREVMEQCDVLLTGFADWLAVNLPGTDPDWMHDHLLLAAKLHDIGMCGTEPLRQVLQATDSLHSLVTAGGENPSRAMASSLRDLRSAQDDPRLGLPSTGDIHRMLMDPGTPRDTLLSALADYHEQIKRAIRRQHAENSGRWVLSHLEELRAHYGPSVDFVTVGALAALHSSSSLEDACIVLQGEDGERVRHHLRQLITQEVSAEEAARITTGEAFRRVVYLSALLRLADTRRQGSRLTAMDGARLVCRIVNGHLRLYREQGGIREEIPLRMSYEILASEAMTGFGPVTAFPNADGTWHIRHEMTLHHAEIPAVGDLFARSRLKTYAGEIDTAMLNYPLGCSHEIFLHMEGVGPIAAGQIVKNWREAVDWLTASPLQITVL